MEQVAITIATVIGLVIAVGICGAIGAAIISAFSR